jgi:hypothetical protein
MRKIFNKKNKNVNYILYFKNEFKKIKTIYKINKKFYNGNYI